MIQPALPLPSHYPTFPAKVKYQLFLYVPPSLFPLLLAVVSSVGVRAATRVLIFTAATRRKYRDRPADVCLFGLSYYSCLHKLSCPQRFTTTLSPISRKQNNPTAQQPDVQRSSETASKQVNLIGLQHLQRE